MQSLTAWNQMSFLLAQRGCVSSLCYNAFLLSREHQLTCLLCYSRMAYGKGGKSYFSLSLTLCYRIVSST